MSIDSWVRNRSSQTISNQKWEDSLCHQKAMAADHMRIRIIKMEAWNRSTSRISARVKTEKPNSSQKETLWGLQLRKKNRARTMLRLWTTVMVREPIIWWSWSMEMKIWWRTRPASWWTATRERTRLRITITGKTSPSTSQQPSRRWPATSQCSRTTRMPWSEIPNPSLKGWEMENWTLM